MKFELTFVEFDQQGEPHPVGTLDSPVRRDLLPVLFEDGQWRGPAWKRDAKNNLVAITARELVRMHAYAYQKGVPRVTTTRLDAERGSQWFYKALDGEHKPVPELEDGTCLSEVPFK